MINKSPIKLSIAVVNWNTKELVNNCLRSIYDTVHDISYEVIVVDNGSTDGSAQSIKENFKDVILIENPTNERFAKPNNDCLEIARGEYFLMLNTDTVVLGNAINNMVDYLDSHKEYGAVTTKLLNEDHSTQYLHRRFPNFFTIIMGGLQKRKNGPMSNTIKKYLYMDKSYTNDFDIEQPAGAVYMVRKSIIGTIGGLFDAHYFPLIYNDVDLSYRIWKHGYKIRCLSGSEVLHLKGVSVKKIDLYSYGAGYAHSSLFYFRKNKLRVDFLILKVVFSILFLGLFFNSLYGYIRKKVSRKELNKRAHILKSIFVLKRFRAYEA